MFSEMNISDFDEMYRIMSDSFPSDEFRPRDEQLALFENPLYHVYVCREDDKITAFIAVWDFESFVFVEHFAVNGQHRSKGIGSLMLKHIKSITSKRLCLEVEPPDSHIRKRRIAFYERNGFSLNDYPYVQPAISKGKNPIPLMLMTTNGKACECELDYIKNVLYKNVYKCI